MKYLYFGLASDRLLIRILGTSIYFDQARQAMNGDWPGRLSLLTFIMTWHCMSVVVVHQALTTTSFSRFDGSVSVTRWQRQCFGLNNPYVRATPQPLSHKLF